MLLSYVFTLGLAAAVAANQEPIIVPQEKERIAIIGAGAGGSAAAYYLQKYTSHGYNITVFEALDKSGGRAATVEVYGNSSRTIELGASVFVRANKILVAATEEFDLPVEKYRSINSSETERVGIYDGNTVFLQFEDSWKAPLKLLWKYGLAPLKVNRLSASFVRKFLAQFYEANFPYESLDVISRITGFLAVVDKTADEYFIKEEGISRAYVKEFAQAVLRGNYVQNTDSAHALSLLVSFSAEDASSVKGGNWQIFDNFVKQAQVDLKLDTKITSIEKAGGSWKVLYGEDASYFDKVVVATPWLLANITGIENIPKVEYKTLHATIFTTTQKLNPLFFGLEADQEVPSVVLTVPQLDRSPTFYTVAVHDYIEDTEEFVYKIFSPEKLSDKDVEQFFGAANITWIVRKNWKAFPVMEPVSSFPDFEIEDGLFYLNTMESFISCMETSALAGANAAALISRGRNTTQLVVP